MFRATMQAAGSVQYLDLNLLSYNSKSLSIANIPWSMQISTDGTKIYIMQNRLIEQFNLSTAFDVSTGTSVGSYTANDMNNSVGFLAISSDGTNMILGDRAERIYSYSLSTAWDITTATYINQITTPEVVGTNEIAVSEDGTKVYIADNNVAPNSVRQYNLSTAWNVSTATYSNVFGANEIAVINGLDFKPDGTKMYINDNNPDAVHQYTLTTPWDVTTAVYDNISLDLTALDQNAKSGVYGRTGKDYYFCGYATRTIYQMEG